MGSAMTGGGSDARHAARTLLNHILGYAEILRQDAAEAGRDDLGSLFEEVREAALALKGPLLAALGSGEEGGAPPGAAGAEVYAALYRLIALMQDAKGKAAARGTGFPGSDAEKVLASANGILELLSPSSPEPEGGTRAEEGRERTSIGDDIAPSEKPGRVLVVDDDELNRELLVRYLERLGHEVRPAADGRAALDLLRDERFDVALIDIMMPGMNGYRLLELMREDERAKDVHVIVISALEDTQSIARCIQLGAEDYLPRQFEPIILKARIESCLEKRRMKTEQELYVSALIETQERLRSELRGGAAYVRSLLPPPLRIPGLAVDWTFIPSASLGGDVFGYHALGGEETGVAAGKVALYLIDVSGHGIEAALYSVTLMNLLKTQALRDADYDDPASVLGRLNSAFKIEDQNNLYFTAWYGVWDPAKKELSYASAGSPPAILLPPAGAAMELSTGGMIVGLSPAARYDACRAGIEDGSRLFLFSDGIFEYRERDGSIHGLERFTSELAARARSGDGGSILDFLVRDAMDASATGRFPDDVSIIEARFG
jgi:phosphoserine phosphatase RsbU/P